jgi:uncharacterized protein (DUF697 family)
MTETEQPASAPEASPELPPGTISAAADSTIIIKDGVIAAMAVGLVPLPGVDMAGILAVQLRMVHQLGEVYGVSLRDNAIKAAVMTLVGGAMPVALAGGLVSAVKLVPGFGSVAGAAGVAILGGGVTYAVGRVFQQHLESNGTFIDFDVKAARASFRRELDVGLKLARSWRRKAADLVTPGAAGTPAEPAKS